MLTTPSAAVRRRATLTVAVGLVAAAAAVLAAVPASAHDRLTGSSPDAGTTVTTAPSEVRLSFTDEVKELGLTVLVTDETGASVTAGAPSVEGTDVVAPLGPIASSGRYAVAYRVVSADGHPISGTVSFTVRLVPAGPTASTAPTPTVSLSAPSAPSAPSATAPSTTAAAAVEPATGDRSASVVAGVGLLAVLVVVGVVLFRRRAA